MDELKALRKACRLQNEAASSPNLSDEEFWRRSEEYWRLSDELWILSSKLKGVDCPALTRPTWSIIKAMMSEADDGDHEDAAFVSPIQEPSAAKESDPDVLGNQVDDDPDAFLVFDEMSAPELSLDNALLTSIDRAFESSGGDEDEVWFDSSEKFESDLYPDCDSDDADEDDRTPPLPSQSKVEDQERTPVVVRILKIEPSPSLFFLKKQRFEATMTPDRLSLLWPTITQSNGEMSLLPISTRPTICFEDHEHFAKPRDKGGGGARKQLDEKPTRWGSRFHNDRVQLLDDASLHRELMKFIFVEAKNSVPSWVDVVTIFKGGTGCENNYVLTRVFSPQRQHTSSKSGVENIRKQQDTSSSGQCAVASSSDYGLDIALVNGERHYSNQSENSVEESPIVYSCARKSQQLATEGEGCVVALLDKMPKGCNSLLDDTERGSSLTFLRTFEILLDDNECGNLKIKWGN